MLVFVLVAKSKHPLKSRKINRLVAKFDSGQGHQAENTTITISYTVGSISYFQRTLSRRVENTRKSSPQPSDLLAFLLVSRENKRSRRLSLFRTRNSADGPQERWRVRQPQADQDRRRLPRRPTEIQRGRVEPRQDFRRDRRRSLSLRHAGREQARQRCLQALADAALSSNTLNKRLRLLGIDTKTDHCAHRFRTTFSTLSHHEEIKDAKARDGDVVELQLASR